MTTVSTETKAPSTQASTLPKTTTSTFGTTITQDTKPNERPSVIEMERLQNLKAKKPSRFQTLKRLRFEEDQIAKAIYESLDQQKTKDNKPKAIVVARLKIYIF